MPRRIDYHSHAREVATTLYGLERFVHSGSLPPALVELVKLRASQLNGCAYCVDMHTKDARAAGETEQRLYAVSVWREAPFFSEAERAALDWTEAVTLLPEGRASDARFEETRRHFSEREMIELTVAIVAINSWNRLAVSLGADVGSYVPRKKE